MAGTLTVTKQSPGRGPGRPVTKIVLAWTSTAGGVVSGNLTDYVSGELVRVVFAPAAGGSQPSDAYDVTLVDEAGVDVLAGQGGNLSNANTTHVCPGVPHKDGTTTGTRPIALDDRLELVIANAGATKGGTITLYVR